MNCKFDFQGKLVKLLSAMLYIFQCHGFDTLHKFQDKNGKKKMKRYAEPFEGDSLINIEHCI
jgi:CO dehydrogenase/acetyl-CoA synthase alpha subunit